MKKYIMLITITALTLFGINGCGGGGGGGSSPKTTFHIAFICQSTPDTDATAYKAFLETAGHTVDIIPRTGIAAADFSSTDLMIISKDNVVWDIDYPTETTKLYNANKPILCIYTGNHLFDASDFGLFIGHLHSMTGGTRSGITVDDSTAQFWRTPNSISATTGEDFVVLSSGKETQEIYWSSPPAAAGKLGYTIGNSGYSPLCHQTKNTIRYFQWGFTGAPADMTTGGQNLFKNILYWLVNGTI